MQLMEQEISKKLTAFHNDIGITLLHVFCSMLQDQYNLTFEEFLTIYRKWCDCKI